MSPPFRSFTPILIWDTLKNKGLSLLIVTGFVFDEASISSLVLEIVKMKDFSHLNVLMLVGMALDNRNKSYPCLVVNSQAESESTVSGIENLEPNY